MAQWLELATDDREFTSSNPTGAAWELWQFPLPILPLSFERDTKTVGPFYLVSVPGEVKFPTKWVNV